MFGNRKKEIKALIESETEAACNKIKTESKKRINELRESEKKVKKMVDEICAIKAAIDSTVELLKDEQPEVGKVIDLSEKLEALSKKIDNLEAKVCRPPVMGGRGYIPPAESEYGELYFM